MARPGRELHDRYAPCHRAVYADLARRHQLRSDTRGSGHLHAAVEDAVPVVSSPRTELTADGIPVRRVLGGDAVRASEEAGHEVSAFQRGTFARSSSNQFITTRMRGRVCSRGSFVMRKRWPSGVTS